MIKIAVVEDDDEEYNLLVNCLERYKAENDEEILYTRYQKAGEFLEEYARYDIVFMDIMLPDLTGMETAVRLREKGSQIVLIFVTTMAQFAVKSYEVDALDYIIKPVSYYRLTMKLRKAIQIIKSNASRTLTINDAQGVVQVSSEQLLYVEVRGHKLTYHTKVGVYNEYGSLSDLEKILKEHNFMRCNSCYLVNPKYIAHVNNSSLMVILENGEELKISQPRRKAFIGELTTWLGQGKL